LTIEAPGAFSVPSSLNSKSSGSAGSIAPSSVASSSLAAPASSVAVGIVVDVKVGVVGSLDLLVILALVAVALGVADVVFVVQ